ncbi:MAG: LysM peptidoglycan-binding domain-containing protein [Candidatus Brocadia sp.]|nr:LysM peptidoglycan-binding domain-containing protein [Candidatus Brocadia sp.]
MKRDVQVGVTLGVIILAIIGVFLSTRTTVKEPTIPVSEIEEETQVDPLDVSELSPGPQNAPQESLEDATTAMQNAEQKTPVVASDMKDEQPAEKEDNVVEGVWNKAQEKEAISIAKDDTKASAVSNQEDWKDVSSGDVEKTGSISKIHKVQHNDSLRKIAKKYYGDESRWLLIFNANRDVIQDSNSIRIGTELIIPEDKTTIQKTKAEIKAGATTPALSQIIKVEDAKPTARKHVVQQGDSLYMLAGKYYDDGAKWNKILEANKKILKDQKSLKIGQALVIPDL